MGWNWVARNLDWLAPLQGRLDWLNLSRTGLGQNQITARKWPAKQIVGKKASGNSKSSKNTPQKHPEEHLWSFLNTFFKKKSGWTQRKGAGQVLAAPSPGGLLRLGLAAAYPRGRQNLKEMNERSSPAGRKASVGMGWHSLGGPLHFGRH